MPKLTKKRKISKATAKKKKEECVSLKPAHRWRLCPAGEHYREGSHVSSYEKKDGTVVTDHPRRSTCVKNRSGKDQLYSEEIREIPNRHFNKFKEQPLAKISEFGGKGQLFDSFIRGWTQYWNEVLLPDVPLEPEVVKALIASESSFNTKANNHQKGPKRARGLMEALDGTLSYLKEDSKELRDHFVNLTEDDMLDPNLSVCAGIRWLFRKREIATVLLKRKATWEEAVANYKRYHKEHQKNPNHRGMKFYRLYYQELKK